MTEPAVPPMFVSLLYSLRTLLYAVSSERYISYASFIRTIPSIRQKPMLHAPVDAPLCDVCQLSEFSFFDPNCPSCQELLLEPTTSVSQIFSVLRQWTPQTQQNLEILVREVRVCLIR